MRERSARVPFADGQILSVCGTALAIRHTGGRGVVRIDGGSLLVPGDAAFVSRRVREWLKKTARHEMLRIACARAPLIGRAIGKVTLRDTHSRWGSCSSDGSLSFSWRLVLAPPEVLEYVVCHEVAHLLHHNHSTAFWEAVEKLCPEHRKARKWLKTHGATLWAYG